MFCCCSLVIFHYLGVYLPVSFIFKDTVFLKMGYQPQKYYWISYPILALIPKMWDKGKDNLLSAFCFVSGNAMILFFFLLPSQAIKRAIASIIPRKGFFHPRDKGFPPATVNMKALLRQKLYQPKLDLPFIHLFFNSCYHLFVF